MTRHFWNLAREKFGAKIPFGQNDSAQMIFSAHIYVWVFSESLNFEFTLNII